MKVIAKPFHVDWTPQGCITRLRGNTLRTPVAVEDRLASLRVDGQRVTLEPNEPADEAGHENGRELTCETHELSLTLETRQAPGEQALQRRMTVRNLAARPRMLDWICLWDLAFEEPLAESHPHFDPFGMQAPLCLFLRGEQEGLFAGIEHPFFHMSVDSAGLQSWYEPHWQLQPGERHTTEWAFLGAWRGQQRPIFKSLTQAYPLLDPEQELLDEGEAQAMRAYLRDGRGEADASEVSAGPREGAGGAESRSLQLTLPLLLSLVGTDGVAMNRRGDYLPALCVASDAVCEQLHAGLAQRIAEDRINVLYWTLFGEFVGDRPAVPGVRECFSSEHGHLPGWARYREWRNLRALCRRLQATFPRLQMIFPPEVLRYGPWFERVEVDLPFLAEAAPARRAELLQLYTQVGESFSFEAPRFVVCDAQGGVTRLQRAGSPPQGTGHVNGHANGVGRAGEGVDGAESRGLGNGSPVAVDPNFQGIEHLYYLGDPPRTLHDPEATPLDPRIAAAVDAPVAIRHAIFRPPIVVPHDHLLDEASLLEQASCGVLAKTAIVMADALLWEDGGVRFKDSIRSFEGWNALAKREIATLKRLIEANAEHLLLATSYADIEQASAEGRSAVLIGFEGGKPIEGSLEKLRELHALGLRQLQFTWAFRNQLADAQEESEDRGLTAFGREVVHEINRLGIVGDMTHISRRAFFDVLEETAQPVIASHSSSFSFCPDPGNLDDEMLRALARNGGVAGVHFCSHIVKAPNCFATIEDVLDMICAMVDLAGVDHVGMGCDYLPYDEAYRTAQRTFMTETDARGRERIDLLAFVKGLDRIGQLERLASRLRGRGFEPAEVQKIMGGNWLRVYRQVLR